MKPKWLVVGGCVLSVLLLWFLRASFVRQGPVDQPTEILAPTDDPAREVIAATSSVPEVRVVVQPESSQAREEAGELVDDPNRETETELILHVLDAATGRPLDDLEVRVEFGFVFSRSPDPVLDRPLLESATRSPVRVVAESVDSFQTATVNVRAPAFAWAEVIVDLSESLECTVLLVPGGDVCFVVLNGPAPAGAVLEAVVEGAPIDDNGYSPTVGRVADCHTGLGYGVTISGVKAGVALVDVRIGRDSMLETGAVQFTVKPGVVTRVELPLRTNEPEDPFIIAGTLRVSSEWGLDPCELYVRSDGSETTDARAAVLEQVALDEWRWTIQVPRSGAYFWAIPEVPFGGTFLAEPHSLVDLVVGDPAHLSLELIDPRTEQPAVIKALGWWPVGAFFPDYASFVKRRQARDPITGRFELRVPVGKGYPRPSSHELSVPRGATVIVAGSQRLDLRLVERTSFGVRILSDGRFVRVGRHWQPAFEQLDGAGTCVGGRTSVGERSFSVSWPGTYRITWPQLDGFAQIEPSELVLHEGENELVVLELNPLR